MNYYAIQVKTKNEGNIIQLLNKQIIKLNNCENIKIHWPQKKMTIRKKGIKKETKSAIYPGYIFLEAKEIDSEIYWLFKNTDGVYKFLKSNTNIEPLTGNDKILLLHFLSFGETIGKSTVYFDENSKIHIKKGPLKGLEGSIIKVDKRKRRAKVKLNLYDSSFAVDFSFEVLELTKTSG